MGIGLTKLKQISQLVEAKFNLFLTGKLLIFIYYFLKG